MSALYLQALRTSLPQELVVQVDELCKSPPMEALLETLIRFTAGGEPSTDVSIQTRKEWVTKQSAAQKALDDLDLPNGRKRSREDDAVDPQNAVKRPKLPEIQSNLDDPPIFCLHSISVTSPVRKKVDITIHKSTIRFTHPSSNTIEAVVPLSSLKRAFILPTRGKQKAHWTVVLLSSDAPERGKASSATANPQIIFGLDATAPTSMTTTNYLTPSDPAVDPIPKGAETLSSIRKLISHVDTPVLQPTPDVFRSACAGNAASASTGGVPGIEAYLHAKPGSLWFMKEGILWGESKPCEFWAVDDLIGKTDGLRMLSATGRTCSVILTRKDTEADEDADTGIETEFAMVDGKEQEGINQWVRDHRHLFGQKSTQTGKPSEDNQRSAHADVNLNSNAKVNANATTINAAQLGDESDASDESFDMDSDDDDGGSVTSSDSSEGENGNRNDAESDGESAEGEETDGEDEDDLRPENHPLMRPGAMPRMSRAAIDAVVGMVNDDLMGGGASEGEDELSDD
jgi:Histone chaperone Rttp106-like